MKLRYVSAIRHIFLLAFTANLSLVLVQRAQGQVTYNVSFVNDPSRIYSTYYPEITSCAMGNSSSPGNERLLTNDVMSGANAFVGERQGVSLLDLAIVVDSDVPVALAKVGFTPFQASARNVNELNVAKALQSVRFTAEGDLGYVESILDFTRSNVPPAASDQIGLFMITSISTIAFYLRVGANRSAGGSLGADSRE